MEWAKRVPHFSELPLDDQVILLRAGEWPGAGTTGSQAAGWWVGVAPRLGVGDKPGSGPRWGPQPSLLSVKLGVAWCMGPAAEVKTLVTVSCLEAALSRGLDIPTVQPSASVPSRTVTAPSDVQSVLQGA